MSQIEAEENKYSKEFFNKNISDYKELSKKYVILKQEVKELEELKKVSLKLDEKGMVYLEPATDIENILVTLFKANDNIGDEITSKPLSNNQVSMLQEMRKSGVGTYFVIAQKGFQYLKSDNTITSNTQEVKMLTNTLGHLTLTGKDFTEKEGAGNSGKIRINLANGTLEWDSVENATSYDVYGEVTIDTIEGWMGKYYLNPMKDSMDYSNLENENNFSVLEVENNKTKWDNNLNKARLLCAGNLKETKLNLKDILVSSGTYEDDLSLGAESHMFIKLWIVPRNVDGLYVSGIEAFFNEPKSFEDNVVMENFQMKDYLSKILKVN